MVLSMVWERFQTLLRKLCSTARNTYDSGSSAKMLGGEAPPGRQSFEVHLAHPAEGDGVFVLFDPLSNRTNLGR